MKTYCIYIHTNKINGKSYIGQTCQKPEKRWRNGEGYVESSLFYNAIKKYGWDNFTHKILCTDLTLEEANKLEEKLIAKYDTTNRDKGYNCLYGGLNYTRTPEMKAEISRRQIGHEVKQSTRDKLAAFHRGLKPSDETRAKWSKRNMGRKWYNNGITNRFCYEKPEGDEWKLGMLSNMSNEHKEEARQRVIGKHWYTDGINNILADECPEGWYIGQVRRTTKKIFCPTNNQTYPSIGAAAEVAGVSKQSVRDVCLGKTKRTKGYEFKYID